ncbi:MAG: response regulator, partial [Gammaproteobacteria bacterium]|nr:response regulator [Gammaproteobacteria bacterium]
KEETYAIPLNTIEGIVRVSPYELEAYYAPEAPLFEYAGQPYRLFYLGKLLNKEDDARLEGEMSALPVILARSGDQAVALQVDRVIGSREIVSKALGPQFSDLTGVSGATVLGDGSVVVILDVMSFVRLADLRPRSSALEQVKTAATKPKEVAQEQPPALEEDFETRVRTVMIVDDSVTVRKVTSRLIERQGWDVVTAKDGVDAINQLQDIYPDIMLLDIEMPKMDGFEVLSTVRRDERLKNLPVIMITSRTGAKHKEQALALGVNRYLGKPFQEASLLSTIEEVLAEVRSQHG